MEKTVYVFAALLLTALGAKSQDTVWSTVLNPDYYQSEGSWFVDTDTGYVSVGGSATYTLIGKPFITKDSLTVYGIAAMFDKPELEDSYYTISDFMVDTTLDKAFEYVALYDAGFDSLIPLSERKRIHLRDSTPAYYLGTRWRQPYAGNRVTEVHGVYEVYFQAPIMVKDSFYVAMTRESFVQYDGIDAPIDSLGHTWSSWPVGQVCYTPEATDTTDRVFWIEPYEYYRIYSPRRGWVYESSYGAHMFLFPILTPRAVDTTTTVDTTTVDTVGIATLRTVERYVNLLPNPASERVQVTSSFGLRGIEVYNAAGLKVHELKASGYAATLDISALPEGSYLVRVATPSGTVTKKLVVQRR